MLGKKSSKIDQAFRLEKKGDELMDRGKFTEAFKQYQKAEALNPERSEIYRKLQETFEKLDRDWSEEDFSLSLSWTLRQQQLENPELLQVYEKFTPEYKTIHAMAQRLLVIPSGPIEDELKNEIFAFGDKATLPLLNLILEIKATLSAEPPSSPDEVETP